MRDYTKGLVRVRNAYMVNPTRNLLGYNARLNQRTKLTDKEIILAVRGTFDILARTKFDRGWTTIYKEGWPKRVKRLIKR
jgi:hypothetical protein